MTRRSKTPHVVFPRAQVESTLRAWWDGRTASALARRRPPEQCRNLGGTVFDIQPAISSIEAVPVMCQLETLLGFQLAKNVMPRDGYNSREQFVRDLGARLEMEYAKHHGLNGARARTADRGVRPRG